MQSLWLVGSSIVYWAGMAAIQTFDQHLGLSEVSVQWMGERGMTLDTLHSTLDIQFKNDKCPTFLFIHCGSNDLTTEGVSGKDIIENIKTSILRYKALFKDITIIWSSLLARRYWHFAPIGSGSQIDKKRKRVNAAIKSFVLHTGGKVIHNDSYIKVDEASLYRTDGTHLSNLGNNILLKNWKPCF